MGGKQHACRVDSNKKCNEDRNEEEEEGGRYGWVVDGLSQSGRRWVASASACWVRVANQSRPLDRFSIPENEQPKKKGVKTPTQTTARWVINLPPLLKRRGGYMAMTLQGPISEQLYAHSWPFSHFHFLLLLLSGNAYPPPGKEDRHQRYPPINALIISPHRRSCNFFISFIFFLLGKKNIQISIWYAFRWKLCFILLPAFHNAQFLMNTTTTVRGQCWLFFFLFSVCNNKAPIAAEREEKALE